MKQYQPTELRNVALLGHQGSGKTSLVESIAHVTGIINQRGSIESGTTLSDFTKEEKNQKISIYSSIVPAEWNNFKYNFFDTPGFLDFVGEIDGVLRVARSAVLLIDAQKGIEVGTKRAWRFIRSNSLPAIIFINKMDKENIKFDELIEDVRAKLGKRAVPFAWPIGRALAFEGFVNVVDMKARIYNGVSCVDGEIWEEKREKVNSLHDMIIESVANIDDTILEKYLGGEEITIDEVRHGLRQGILNGELVPIIVGSTQKEVGIHTLLNMIQQYLPSEADMRHPFGEAIDETEIIERKVHTDEPLSGIVFKTVIDPFIGKISYVSVRSGVLKQDMSVLVSNKDLKIKVGKTLFIRGKEQIETDYIGAGDVGILIKMDDLETGDTICDVAHPIKYESIHNPQPAIFFALNVEDKKDDGKIAEALRKISMEDLTIHVERNAETKQLIVGCLGQLHIDTILEKLKSIYNIKATLEDAKISYRETIKKHVDEIEGRYVKQSGGSGQYGIVKMKFEPTEKEYEFVDDIFGGSVPNNFIPAVEKGFVDSLKSGVLAGFPVIGVKATLYDGKYHPVDSSELAFKMAASIAFKDGCKKAIPALLEPIMEIRVVVPNDYVGDIMGDLNKRRGLITGIEPIGEEQIITADVPQNEIGKYIIDLKTMTQAQASFTMKFSRYAEVPPHLVDKIIKENKVEEGR